jgi:hypothetical protein
MMSQGNRGCVFLLQPCLWVFAFCAEQKEYCMLYLNSITKYIALTPFSIVNTSATQIYLLSREKC